MLVGNSLFRAERYFLVPLNWNRAADDYGCFSRRIRKIEETAPIAAHDTPLHYPQTRRFSLVGDAGQVLETWKRWWRDALYHQHLAWLLLCGRLQKRVDLVHLKYLVAVLQPQQQEQQ